MGRLTKLLLAAGLGASTVAVLRHLGGGGGIGRRVPGGILVGNVGSYDVLGRLLLGSLYRSIAADVAAVAPSGARVLEVGSGPGYVSIHLARDYGLDVTGLDLDPEMVERAKGNVERWGVDGASQPAFVVGDAASLPFPDASFDLVVSTFSMHHWDDPAAGIAEIARVLRPDGRALIWDLRPGPIAVHRGLPDPVERVHGAPLRVATATPWRWPWRLSLAERIELVPESPSPELVAE